MRWDKLVVVDFETTDIDYAKANNLPIYIIEIGAVTLNSDCEVVDRFSELVKPESFDTLTDFVTDLTGISRKDLESVRSLREVYTDFAKFSGSKRLAAWNAYYEKFVLENLLFETKHHLILDLATLAYFKLQEKEILVSNLSLREVATLLSVDFPKNHRAVNDAELAISVIKKITLP